MSPAAKLAGFSALLVVLFGGAAFAGGAIGPDRDGERPAAPHGGGHEAVATDADTVRGLAVSDGGVTLALEQTELARGRATELRFGIVDAAGQRVRDFEVEHEKRMHLIVVRRDGHGFQHLHPELGADGIWRTRVTLPDAGAYRVFADFKRGGTAQTLAADLRVDGRAEYEPLPAPATTTATGDGYEVRLDAGRVHAGRDA
jgi:hypothetical protein